MSEYNEPFSLLEDIRARVIYYSCLAEPKNTLEISRLWNYKTSTYFYQAKTKKLIQEMISKNLVETTEGTCYKSNYDLLLDKKDVGEFFEKKNNKVSNDIIIEKYDYEVSETQLDDRLFKEFCIEKKPELKEILKSIVINSEERNSFVELWKNRLFRKNFLSTDVVKKLIDDRQELPEDPRELLFNITAKICESFYDYLEEGEFDDPFNTDYSFSIDEAMPLIFAMLKASNEKHPEESKIFFEQLKKVYQIMKEKKKKYESYQHGSEVSAYHVEKIVEMIGLKKSTGRP